MVSKKRKFVTGPTVSQPPCVHLSGPQARYDTQQGILAARQVITEGKPQTLQVPGDSQRNGLTTAQSSKADAEDRDHCLLTSQYRAWTAKDNKVLHYTFPLSSTLLPIPGLASSFLPKPSHTGANAPSEGDSPKPKSKHKSLAHMLWLALASLLGGDNSSDESGEEELAGLSDCPTKK
ncbi:hypothetical protein Moror_7529 [Moniliophthora roreri MCA 2997]|uniref:Uncharacterized protein n=1 Tax=Moniliophthora roreri (strain MCA 2997) TaxID=1381753 RepID=V2XX11_MONRO|nr:hypothetical protein Moror_7529 [Moniliophthora roreri MCA 2997]